MKRGVVRTSTPRYGGVCSQTTMLARASRCMCFTLPSLLRVATVKPPSRHSCQTGESITLPSRRWVASTASSGSSTRSPRSSMARFLRTRARLPVSQPKGLSCLVGAGRPRPRCLMMRVFVAGATGAIGRQVVPRLVAAGHQVTGMTRSESKQAMIRDLGAVPVVADALDPDQVADAVGRARPDVIVHELTALTGVERYTERDAAATNRLRTEGTDHLLSAGQAAGVRRFVAQGVAGFGAYARAGGRCVAQGVAGFGAYARSGGPVKSEKDPLDPTPVAEMRGTLAAIRHLE